MMYIQLFLSFFQISLFSFGGGYAALPLIQGQVVNVHHWLSMTEFTVDMSIFDLYNGKCEFVKAGAAVTFLRTKDGVEHIRSESLPLGVIQRQQSEKETRQLESGDVVVMVSDGILDALPAGEQEHLLDLMIGGSPLENPEELANYILDKVLELAAGKAGDDMTVLVAGIWKMCYSR